ncbi:MAG: hypothetical protein Q9Q40_11910 [Acidobacteriota bacterium]|nr:hypothetical protein [Acidobacteriota bacterium]
MMRYVHAAAYSTLVAAVVIVGVWGYMRGHQAQTAADRREAAHVAALEREGVTVADVATQRDLDAMAAEMGAEVARRLEAIRSRLDARVVAAMRSEGRAVMVDPGAPPPAGRDQSCPPPVLDLGVQVAAVATEGDRVMVAGEQWAEDRETGRRWTRALEADVTDLLVSRPRRRPERWMVGVGLGATGDGVSQVVPTLDGLLVGPPLDPRWRIRVRPWGGLTYGLGRIRVGEADVRPRGVCWGLAGGCLE